MIYRPEDTTFSTPVGEIDRVFKDLCTSLLEKDSFTARFPPEASPEMRLAILTSVLLVEMCVDGEAPLPPSGGAQAPHPSHTPPALSRAHTHAGKCLRTRRTGASSASC